MVALGRGVMLTRWPFLSVGEGVRARWAEASRAAELGRDLKEKGNGLRGRRREGNGSGRKRGWAGSWFLLFSGFPFLFLFQTPLKSI